MKTQQMIYLVSLVLVLVGALNWGLVAVDKDYNLVEMTVGADNAYIVYYIVAAAALYVGYCELKRARNM